MSRIKYTISEVVEDQLTGTEILQDKDLNLIGSFNINSTFDKNRNFIEFYSFDSEGNILYTSKDYKNYTLSLNSETDNDRGAAIVDIDPLKDILKFNLSPQDQLLHYNFLDDIYSNDSSQIQFYIEEISDDRTELKLSTLELKNSILKESTEKIKKYLKDSSFFDTLRLNFGDNDLIIFTNIDTLSENEDLSVVIKLYEPLPLKYSIKSTLGINSVVSISKTFQVETEIVDDETFTTPLKGPNFNVELEDNSSLPSEYFNINDLFGYSVTGSNSQIFSLFNEKGIELSIDYSSFNYFVKFGSAEERVRNFKYKLDLIQSSERELALLNNNVGEKLGISGSRASLEGTISNILNNFDHYDRFLYYESGSYSWPKSNDTKPYLNLTSSAATTFFDNLILSASNYDLSNENKLENTIPSFLREDPENEKYILFLDMIGQHFDNLSIYTDAVSSKYNTDHRLNRGISKDLVSDALKSFGVKLYNNNRALENLFSIFTGEFYQTGSEQITNFITASNIPTSQDNYEKEINKRLYHNLPLLIKSKGTERGLKALLNSFGIPISGSNKLDIILRGGTSTYPSEGALPDNGPFFSPDFELTSSLDKIRINNTGSVYSNILSSETSIIQPTYKYTDDVKEIEIGFSPQNSVNDFIKSASYAELSSSGTPFNIDDYIGDPGNEFSSSYSGLQSKVETYVGDIVDYDYKDFIRLIKFYNNTLFKMIKDFSPARDSISTGIIFKPHILERNKIKRTKLNTKQFFNPSNINSYQIGNLEHTGSININSTSGSHGGVYHSASVNYITSHSIGVQTKDGVVSKQINEQPKFNGELSGSIFTATTQTSVFDNPWRISSPTDISYKINFESLTTVSDDDEITLLLSLEANSSAAACSATIQEGTFRYSGTLGIGTRGTFGGGLAGAPSGDLGYFKVLGPAGHPNVGEVLNIDDDGDVNNIYLCAATDTPTPTPTATPTPTPSVTIQTFNYRFTNSDSYRAMFRYTTSAGTIAYATVYQNVPTTVCARSNPAPTLWQGFASKTTITQLSSC
tara:strand:- start:1684 stop:4782 length:3099 start_codon:yes stop_codon:yes gene_type:complete